MDIEKLPVLDGPDWRFVVEFTAGRFAGNAARAYALSRDRDPQKPTDGDSAGGRRLLARQDVADAVQTLRLEVREAEGMTVNEHLAMLATIRDEARDARQFGAAARAESLRGKVAGYYIERVASMHLHGDLSEQDMMSELAGLVQQFPEVRSALLGGDEAGAGTPNGDAEGGRRSPASRATLPNQTVNDTDPADVGGDEFHPDREDDQ